MLWRTNWATSTFTLLYLRSNVPIPQLFSIFLPPQSEDFLIQKLNFLLDMIFLYWKLVSIEDKYYEFIYIKFLMAYRVLL